MTPRAIDVILPAYNAEDTILVALHSLLLQTAPDFRVIVIDDGSTDRTAEIVAELARTDGRIMLDRRENGGIVAALNHGLTHSDATFVARMDADDICAPDRFEKQMQYLHDNPDVVAISGAHEEIDAAGELTHYIHRPPARATADFSWVPAREPQLTHPFLFMRADALKQVQGYRHVKYAEDSDLYWRLAEVGHLSNLTDVMGRYRMHAASVSSASVTNGRIMALLSQLAALSAARRADGQTDLVFDPALSARLEKLTAMKDLLDASVSDLDITPAEKDRLALAVAAKLMELAGYRPYEITPDDCTFIAAAFGRQVGLSPANRTELAKMRSATAARLLRLGRVGDAMRLSRPGLWPQTIVRAVTGRLYWNKHLS